MTPRFDRLDDPARLAELGVWPEAVYRDLLAIAGGTAHPEDFHARYQHRKAILVIDATGMTSNSLARGEIDAFIRIVRFQQVCEPVLRHFGATLIRAFADDIVALFDTPKEALEAAHAIHEATDQADTDTPRCCVGIGYGDVFAIGPNLAMGNEMNMASKLGEDTAVAGETLVTASVFEQLKDSAAFEPVTNDELPFRYYRALNGDGRHG